jgi:hypothetical protein
MELAVEIRRRVAGKVDRPILDQRFGMADAHLEGQPVDERLQRRSGGANGSRHVDKTVAALVEQPGGAD